MRGRPRANRRQHRGKRLEAIELVAVAAGAPAGVIAVLLATARVATGRLQMTFRVRSDPDVLPGGRDRPRANALQVGRIAGGPAVRAGVAEPGSGRHSTDTGMIVSDVMEARKPGWGQGGKGRCHRDPISK